MIDCGCTSTSICEGSTPKSHLASIISNPLFISVEESMVTFSPMCQLGCASACALVTLSSCSLLKVRKGPPEAVSSIFSILFSPSPFRHWKMAECSESTGRTAVLCFSASEVISSPATTSVSLFARAIALPALIASMVGFRPEKPTIAVSTISIFCSCTTSSMALLPHHTLMGRSLRAAFSCSYFCSFAITTTSGIKRRACAMSSSTLLLATSA